MTDDDAKADLRRVWVELTRDEAVALHQALDIYLEEDPPDRGWHAHLGDPDGVELTISVPG